MNDKVLREILEIDDWRHPYQLRDGQTVKMAKSWFTDWHQWRLGTVLEQQEAALPGGLTGAKVLDIACNDGFYGFDLLKRGASSLVGLEARDDALQRARLIKDHFEFHQAEFVQANVQTYDLKSLPGAPFDLVLFYGILYHLSNPVETLKAIAEVTEKQLSIQTFVTGDEDPVLRLWTENLVLPGAGMQTVALNPSQSAVAWMLEYAGFDLIVRVCPPYFWAKDWKPHGPRRHFAFFHAFKGDEGDCAEIRNRFGVTKVYEQEATHTQVIEIDHTTEPLIPNFAGASRTAQSGDR